MNEKGWPFLEGPNRPLDGLTYKQRQQCRTAGIAKMLRDGVPAMDVVEAFNSTQDAVHKIASRNKIPTEGNRWWPLGTPAL